MEHLEQGWLDMGADVVGNTSSKRVSLTPARETHTHSISNHDATRRLAQNISPISAIPVPVSRFFFP